MQGVAPGWPSSYQANTGDLRGREEGLNEPIFWGDGLDVCRSAGTLNLV